MKDRLKYQKIIGIVLLSFFFVSTVGIFRHPFFKEYALDKAGYYFNGGDYNLSTAAKWYKVAAFLGDKSAFVDYQLARIYFVDNKLDEAKKMIDISLAKDPENKRAFYIRGLIDGFAKNYGEAIGDFEKFTAWSPQEWAGWNDLAWVSYEAGDYAKAKEAALEGLKIDANNPWLLNHLGLAYLGLDEKDQAKGIFAKAAEKSDLLTLEEWQKAYPGNDPDSAEWNLAKFKANVKHNAELNSWLAASNLTSNATSLKGITVSACAASSYGTCVSGICQANYCMICDSTADTMYGGFGAPYCCTSHTSECSNNSQCCVPSSACAANTCIGETCSDGCGGTVAGTKSCPSHAVDGPACVNKVLQKCDAWCTAQGAWCNATSWTNDCAGSWYNDAGYQTPVQCCVNSDCQSGYTCISNVCVCTDTSWSPDPSTRCSDENFTQTSNCGNTRPAIGTKVCTSYFTSDGPVCINKTLKYCSGYCTDVNPWCNATTWTGYCPSGFTNVYNYQNPVACCVNADCGPGCTCTGNNICNCPVCTPNNCEINTCPTDICWNNCKWVWGIKNCPPAPTLTLTANPNPVAYNTPSTLSWTVSNATWCWGEPWLTPTTPLGKGWKDSASGTHNESTGNLIAARTYTLTCGNSGPATVTRSVTVNVNVPPAPILTLTANPNPVNYNSPSTLTWTTANATSCWATNGWTGWKIATGGNESTGNLTAAKTYSLECWNSGVSSGVKSVTVNVACNPNCNDSSGYCQGTTYSGNCGQTCNGTLPASCGSWGACNKGCGGGIQTRSCFCPSTTETRACNSQPCPPGYREVTPW